MYSKKNIIYIVLFCILFVACKREVVQNRKGLQIYTMQECEHKSFLLDDSTTQVLKYIQTFVENDSLKLALYNAPVNNICFFDVKSGKSIKKIQLFEDGPNALKENFQGFHYQSTDSIWIFKNWPEEICLVDSKGVIFWKKKIDEINSINSNYAAPEILPNSNLPIKKIGDYLILQGQGFKRENSDKEPGVTLLYNIKDETIITANPYPAIYGDDENIWQVFAYRTVPYDVSDEHKMVLSFPADDSLRVYDIRTGNISAYFAGHSINHKIKPSSSSTRAGMEKHVLGQAQYPGIYYDQWNDLYYRIMTLPASDYDKNAGSKLRRELCVIILNNEFEKVGEYLVKERSHTYSHAFVSQEGLHINVLSDNDDYLTFITLKPCKL